MLVDLQTKVSNSSYLASVDLTEGDRYFGFTGYVDTLESLNFAYGELNKLGMLPALQAKARPLI